MLKKSIFLYLSFFTITLFVLMVVLVSVSIVRASNYKVFSSFQDYQKMIKTNEANAKDLVKIRTDKEKYLKNENVNINFEYQGYAKAIKEGKSQISVKARKDIGNNFSVAFIEYESSDGWIAIEPVLRCSNECMEACDKSQLLEAGKKMNFLWNKKILKCSIAGEEEENAPLGRYRIVASVWDESSNKNVRIYSNEFNLQ
ncbi:hypothetical protein C0583_01620 [Candidatus Parcubacteria bacterium]|nr:MAG: hypothetical protein C0583_01620 [Candidatus Parcubacteria bacterium]